MNRLTILLLALTFSGLAEARHDRGGIQIIDALYGTGYRQCDARYAVSHCDGRSQCNIRASNNLCGDPHKGERKTLSVHYRCGHRDYETRIRERDTGTIVCQDSGRGHDRDYRRQPGDYIPNRPYPRDSRYRQPYGRHQIQILSVDYGRDYRYCDASYAFDRACAGRQSCSVHVSNAMCGDPYKGKKKTAYIEYQCAGRVLSHQVREGDTAYLDCR